MAIDLGSDRIVRDFSGARWILRQMDSCPIVSFRYLQWVRNRKAHKSENNPAGLRVEAHR